MNNRLSIGVFPQTGYKLPSFEYIDQGVDMLREASGTPIEVSRIREVTLPLADYPVPDGRGGSSTETCVVMDGLDIGHMKESGIDISLIVTPHRMVRQAYKPAVPEQVFLDGAAIRGINAAFVKGEPYSALQIVSVAHELGHLLGAAGRKPGQHCHTDKCIMEPRLNQGVYNISQSHARGILSADSVARAVSACYEGFCGNCQSDLNIY